MNQLYYRAGNTGSSVNLDLIVVSYDEMTIRTLRVERITDTGESIVRDNTSDFADVEAMKKNLQKQWYRYPNSQRDKISTNIRRALDYFYGMFISGEPLDKKTVRSFKPVTSKTEKTEVLDVPKQMKCLDILFV